VFFKRFAGRWDAGIEHVEALDGRPWYAPVKGFKPPSAGSASRLRTAI